MVAVIKKKDRLPQITHGERTWEKRGIGGDRFAYVAIERDDGDKYDNEMINWDRDALVIAATCSCREDIEIPRKMLEEFLAAAGFKVVPITQEEVKENGGG